MVNEYSYVILLNIALIVQLVGLSIAVITDTYVDKRKKRLFLLIILCVSVLLAQNELGHYFAYQRSTRFYRLLMSILGYILSPLIILLFIAIMNEGKRLILETILVVINIIIHLTALFSGLVFYINSDNGFVRGPLGFTCHIISGILLCILLSYAVKEFDRKRKIEMVIPIIVFIILIIAVYLDTFYFTYSMQISALMVSIVSTCLIYYIWLYIQFVRKYEEVLLREQRYDVMMSQIRPHFLYNTLTTIQALCTRNPEKAAELTARFGEYLRSNMDFLESKNLIPVVKEIEHTKVYSDIEMVRFDNIELRYDIRDKNFVVPALTIQPMVENAIKHGVRIREHGVVEVTTVKEDNYHVITVKDNGKGFDVDNCKCGDGHIGIDNVKNRIERLLNGSFMIESEIGNGTTVTIKIPEN